MTDTTNDFDSFQQIKDHKDRQSLEQKVLSLYSVGNSYADISSISRRCTVTRSPTASTAITDKVIPAMREWQNRFRKSVRAGLARWHLLQSAPRRQSGHSGFIQRNWVTLSGKKQVLGIYTAESESAKFWLSVLTDLTGETTCSRPLQFSFALSISYATASASYLQVIKDFARDLKTVSKLDYPAAIRKVMYTTNTVEGITGSSVK